MNVRWPPFCWYLMLVQLVLASENGNDATTPTSNRYHDMCPCLPMNLCPRIHGTSPEDSKYLGEILKCEQEDYVRCCGVSISMVVGIQKQMATFGDKLKQPAALSSVNILAKAIKLNEEEEQIVATTTENATKEDDVAAKNITTDLMSTASLETTAATVIKKTPKRKRRRRLKYRKDVMEVYSNEMSGIPHTTPPGMESLDEVKLFDPEIGANLHVIFARNTTKSKKVNKDLKYDGESIVKELPTSTNHSIHDKKSHENGTHETIPDLIQPKCIESIDPAVHLDLREETNFEDKLSANNKGKDVGKESSEDSSRNNQTNLSKSTEHITVKEEETSELLKPQNDVKLKRVARQFNGFLSPILKMVQQPFKSFQDQVNSASEIQPNTLPQYGEIIHSNVQALENHWKHTNPHDQEGIREATRDSQPVITDGTPNSNDFISLYSLPDGHDETEDISTYETDTTDIQNGTVDNSNEWVVDLSGFGGSDDEEAIPILVPENDLPLDALPEIFPDTNSQLWSIDQAPSVDYEPIFGQFIEDPSNYNLSKSVGNTDQETLPAFIPLETFSVNDLPQEFPDVFESKHNDTMAAIIDFEHKHMIEELRTILESVDPTNDQSITSNLSGPIMKLNELPMARQNIDFTEKSTVKRSDPFIGKRQGQKPFRGHVKFHSRFTNAGTEKPIQTQSLTELKVAEESREPNKNTDFIVEKSLPIKTFISNSNVTLIEPTITEEISDKIQDKSLNHLLTTTISESDKQTSNYGLSPKRRKVLFKRRKLTSATTTSTTTTPTPPPLLQPTKSYSNVLRTRNRPQYTPRSQSHRFQDVGWLSLPPINAQPVGPAMNAYTSIRSIRTPIIRQQMQQQNLNSISSYGFVHGTEFANFMKLPRPEYIPTFPNGEPIQIIGPIPKAFGRREAPKMSYALPAPSNFPQLF